MSSLCYNWSQDVIVCDLFVLWQAIGHKIFCVCHLCLLLANLLFMGEKHSLKSVTNLRIRVVSTCLVVSDNILNRTYSHRNSDSQINK